MEHTFFNSFHSHERIEFKKIGEPIWAQDITLHKIELINTQDRENKLAILHTLESQDPRHQTNFYNELTVLKKIKHENVIVLIGDRTQRDQNIHIFVTEIYDQTAREYLGDVGKPTSETFFSWAHQSLQAIGHLHANEIVHGDIRSNNFYIIGNRIKIAGFFYSKKTQNTKCSSRSKNQVLKSTAWQPLEVLEKHEVSPESDIYSFVTFLWELVSGKIPFEGQDDLTIMRNLNRIPPIQPEIPLSCPRALRELFEAGWTRNADERPSLINIRDRLRKMKDKGIDVTGGNVPTHDNSSRGEFIVGVFIIGAVLALVFAVVFAVFFKK